MFTLITVNTATAEYHPDLQFTNVDDLLRKVNQDFSNTWTSLVVTILPGKEASRGISQR